ncbi:MAG: hypothetical protein KJ046_14770 [Anaerolineae bacterium]|nr:hypothetical protein [Anaerolineae bacterium]
MKSSDTETSTRLSRRFAAILFLVATGILLSAAGCAAINAVVGELPTPALVSSHTEDEATPEPFALVAGAFASAAVEETPAAYIAPIFDIDPEPTPTPTVPVIGPPLPAPTVVVALRPVDFDGARATAQAQGLDLAYAKVGFHTGPGGNATGIGEWMVDLNAAGVPFFLKSTDNAGPIEIAQNIMKANEAAGRFVDHTLVFRLTEPKYEAPFYNLNLSPEEAAAVSWQLNRDNVPAVLEKEYYWLETLNEPGRYGSNGELQIERLGQFSLATAKLAVAEGYHYAAFAFSTGVPEPEDWEHPAMLEFLRYAGEHPDQVGVALHEYSLTADYITAGYPYLVGRFQALFAVCDKYGIPRPTVLITEWGWEYSDVPEPTAGVEDMAWASWLYAAYPQLKGAAVWYLGAQFGGIAQRAHLLILPMRDYATSHYFIYTPGIGEIDPSIFMQPTPTFLYLESQPMPTPFPRPQHMP